MLVSGVDEISSAACTFRKHRRRTSKYLRIVVEMLHLHFAAWPTEPETCSRSRSINRHVRSSDQREILFWCLL